MLSRDHNILWLPESNGYPTSHDFGRYPKKIKLAWPELNYSLGKGVLVLGPSEPSIPCNDP